jgi:hypothetical protein
VLVRKKAGLVSVRPDEYVGEGEIFAGEKRSGLAICYFHAIIHFIHPLCGPQVPANAYFYSRAFKCFLAPKPGLNIVIEKTKAGNSTNSPSLEIL